MMIMKLEVQALQAGVWRGRIGHAVLLRGVEGQEWLN